MGEFNVTLHDQRKDIKKDFTEKIVVEKEYIKWKTWNK